MVEFNYIFPHGSALYTVPVLSHNVVQRRLASTDNSIVRARIDEHTKREAAAVLKTIGLTVSNAFRLLLVRVAAEKALPFELVVPQAEPSRR